MNNSDKNEPILIIFGTQNPVEIWQTICICPPHLKNYTAITPSRDHEVVLFPGKSVWL